MLVLSRKADETLVIDHRIRVTILKAKRGVVRIGISAPREISVVREELCPDDQNARAIHQTYIAPMASIDSQTS